MNRKRFTILNLSDDFYKTSPQSIVFMKHPSSLPDIFSNLGINPKSKCIIKYPKQDLLSLAERENKVLEWTNHNRALRDRLTCKRYPLNYFAEMEKTVLPKRPFPIQDEQTFVEKSDRKCKYIK